MGRAMIVAVQGTKDFNDYQVFLRAMAVAMSTMSTEDNELLIYSVGPTKINSMVSEFTNLSERGMKARGKKIKFFKVPVSYVEENMDYVNYLIFLSKPKELASKLVEKAELKNIEVGIYRY
jgi:hypothetical protein